MQLFPLPPRSPYMRSFATLAVALLVLALAVVVLARNLTPVVDTFSLFAPVPVAVPTPMAADGRAIVPLSAPAPNTVYVFWTGGFDSTFRVLQAVLDEGRIVQPFYLSGNIDNAPNTRVRRRNQQMELRAMRDIRAALCRSYPDVCTRLRPPVLVRDVPIGKRTQQWMHQLAAQRVVRRRTCQYGSLGEFSLYLNVPVELGVVRDGHSNAGIYGGLRDKVSGRGAACRVTEAAVQAHPEYALFRKMAFPLMKVSKPQMWDIAKRGGYDHLLTRTWSCWYPTAAGKPCNKCLMCRERIVRAV